MLEFAIRPMEPTDPDNVAELIHLSTNYCYETRGTELHLVQARGAWTEDRGGITPIFTPESA